MYIGWVKSNSAYELQIGSLHLRGVHLDNPYHRGQFLRRVQLNWWDKNGCNSLFGYSSFKNDWILTKSRFNNLLLKLCKKQVNEDE